MVKILYYYHKKIKILHFFHQNLKILYCCHQNINHFAKKIPEGHSEPIRTYKMEPFAKIVTTFQPLTIFGKSSILDIWLGFEYASESKYKNNNKKADQNYRNSHRMCSVFLWILRNFSEHLFYITPLGDYF